MDLPVIQLVASKGMDTVGDCGICALAVLAGRTYEDVVATAVGMMGEKWKSGLFLTQIIQIGAELGIKLRRRRKYDLDSDTGILNVWITEHPLGRRSRVVQHVVVLMEGKIYDSDLRVWAPDAFKLHYSAEFGLLLELE